MTTPPTPERQSEAQDGGPAPKKQPKWTPKRRQWPNGREYWIASKGHMMLLGKNGSESLFPDKAGAKHYCDQLNAEDAAEALLSARGETK